MKAALSANWPARSSMYGVNGEAGRLTDGSGLVNVIVPPLRTKRARLSRPGSGSLSQAIPPNRLAWPPPAPAPTTPPTGTSATAASGLSGVISPVMARASSSRRRGRGRGTVRRVTPSGAPVPDATPVAMTAAPSVGRRRRVAAARRRGGFATGVDRGGRRLPVHVHRVRGGLQLRRVLHVDGRRLRHRQGRDGPDVLDHHGLVLLARAGLGADRRPRRPAPGAPRRRRRPGSRALRHVPRQLDLAGLRDLRRRGGHGGGLRLRADGGDGRRVVRPPAHRGAGGVGRRHRHGHARDGADVGVADRSIRLADRLRRARHRREQPAAGRQPGGAAAATWRRTRSRPRSVASSATAASSSSTSPACSCRSRCSSRSCSSRATPRIAASAPARRRRWSASSAERASSGASVSARWRAGSARCA